MRYLIIVLSVVLFPIYISCNNQDVKNNNGSANAVESGSINPDNLKQYFLDKYVAQLPAGTDLTVGEMSDSDLKGFKKGTFDLKFQGRGGQPVPFLISKDGKYLILGNNIPVNLDEFEDTPSKSLKKGVITVGGRPLSVLITEDRKQLLVGSFFDTTVDTFAENQNKISLNDVPVKGNEDAKVTVVEYSDFQCPFCKKASDMLPKLLKDYEGKIKVVFKQMPLQNHNWAKAASVASICSYKQGNDKFWSFHDKLFSMQKEIKLETSGEQFKKIAEEIGLNINEYDECIKGKAVSEMVSADMKEAEQLGISSTPTFVINGIIVPGANLQSIKNVINNRLSKEG